MLLASIVKFIYIFNEAIHRRGVTQQLKVLRTCCDSMPSLDIELLVIITGTYNATYNF